MLAKEQKATSQCSLSLARPSSRGWQHFSGGNKLTGHTSHRHRPECGNCSLGSVTLFVDLQVGWRDVGKDAAQRVQPTCLTGCKAAHRTSLAAVIETITECATTNNRFDCHD